MSSKRSKALKMTPESVKNEYKKYKASFQELQKEATEFIKQVLEEHKTIHIAEVKQRPQNKIKSLSSILENVKNPKKYKGLKTLLELKDIAGTRITCFCVDDMEALGTVLVGELKQKYDNVVREDKGGQNNKGKSRPPYRAIHINFTKTTKENGKTIGLNCELQIRTVMADAWAVMDRKYVYGKETEGEAHELTDSIAQIMSGCEKLWTLVKKKSSSSDSKSLERELSHLKRTTEKELMEVESLTNKSLKTSEWIKAHKNHSLTGLKKLKLNTYMEVHASLPSFECDRSKKAILDAARNSTIRTFGWPIGVFADNVDKYRPRPDNDGIHAEISVKEKDWIEKDKMRYSYDYWSIHSNCSFFLLKSIFEDARKPTHIFFNTRIVRITEVLQYLHNLYTKLEIPSHTTIELTITHSGLKNRILGSSNWNRELFRDYKIESNEVSTTIETTLDEINEDIVGSVEKFTRPLFEQFDFFELERHVLEDIVVNYINGKVV